MMILRGPDAEHVALEFDLCSHPTFSTAPFLFRGMGCLLSDLQNGINNFLLILQVSPVKICLESARKLNLDL